MSTDAERREATDQWTIQLREQQLRELRAQLAAAIKRAEAAEAQLIAAKQDNAHVGMVPGAGGTYMPNAQEWVEQQMGGEQLIQRLSRLGKGITPQESARLGRIDELDAMRQRAEAAERHNGQVLYLLCNYGQYVTTDSGTWLLDQIARELLGTEYDIWIKNLKADGISWGTGERPK